MVTSTASIEPNTSVPTMFSTVGIKRYLPSRCGTKEMSKNPRPLHLHVISFVPGQ